MTCYLLEIPGYLGSDLETERFQGADPGRSDSADLVFTASRHSRDMIAQNFRLRSEPIVTPYASTLRRSDIDTGGEALADVPKSFFLYFGGYHSRKGIEQLVQTHTDQFLSARVRSKLVLVGSVHYYSRAFQAVVERALKCGSLVQLGYVSDLQLIWLLKNARAMVYPSLYEGFGLPVLEAMEVGCPVVTTSGTSLPEVCGDSAFVIDPRNGRELAQALCAVEQNEGLRRDLIAKGRSRSQQFNWTRTAADLSRRGLQVRRPQAIASRCQTRELGDSVTRHQPTGASWWWNHSPGDLSTQGSTHLFSSGCPSASGIERGSCCFATRVTGKKCGGS